MEQVRKAVWAEICAEQAVQEVAQLCWRQEQEPQPEMAEEIKKGPDFETAPAAAMALP